MFSSNDSQLHSANEILDRLSILNRRIRSLDEKKDSLNLSLSRLRDSESERLRTLSLLFQELEENTLALREESFLEYEKIQFCRKNSLAQGTPLYDSFFSSTGKLNNLVQARMSLRNSYAEERKELDSLLSADEKLSGEIKVLYGEKAEALRELIDLAGEIPPSSSSLDV